MSSKGIKIIQLAIHYIKNNNIQGLRKALGVMPLDKLNEQAEYLLSVFLATCAGYNRPEAVDIILEAWNVIYPEEENIQILSRLFMINQINIETLSYVVLIHEGFTYVELMDDLMQADSSPEVVTACSKADQIFLEQPYETYQMIFEKADEIKNWRVTEYAIAKMEETAPYQPIPEWVQNYTGGELMKESDLYIPETGAIPFELPSDIEAVEILTSGITQLGLSMGDIEEAKSLLLERLSLSTRQEKIDLLRPIMENNAQLVMGGDTYLFRLFGPANPLVNQDLTLPGKSNMYGGCRMYLCDIFDFDELFDYVEDWFRGACDTCHKRIRERWHAVRKPRPHGGWVGCFCSWDCARDSILEYEEEPDLLTHELINIFEKQIKEIGIQERISSD